MTGFPKLVCIDDFRDAARRKMPKAIFDFVDGAAGHEFTRQSNEDAFRHYGLRPRLMTDISSRDYQTTVFGSRVSIPVLLGPSGMQRLGSREGEVDAARAAARAGTVYVLSASSSRTMEDVAAAAPDGNRWFQLYLWDSREWSESLVRRAADSGYRVLVVTVDSKAPGGRKYRDLRNGLLRPDVYARTALDALRRPRWMKNFLLGPKIRGVHLPIDGPAATVSLFQSPAVIQKRMDPAATWDEIRWLRRIWDGPLVVKGVMTPEDATSAFDAGADGVICSNHGGRVMDGVSSTLEALPRIIEVATASDHQVLLDGGVRTGVDVIKAVAIGAQAVLIGRPLWWGLAVGGEDGVAEILDILRREIDSTMTQLGRSGMSEVDKDAIERLTIPLTDPRRRR